MDVLHRAYLIVMVMVAVALVMGSGFAPLAFATITVCSSGCDNTSIQDAINIASVGDTITIENGTYTENLVVNQSVNIQGESLSVLVNASRASPAINITASHVNITNISVKSWASASYPAAIGISASNVSFLNLTGINITGGFYNIIMNNTINDTILNSEMNGSTRANIYLYNATNISISGNVIRNATQANWGDGIKIYISNSPPSKNIYIMHNSFIYNAAYGIEIMGGVTDSFNNSEIINNTFFSVTSDARSIILGSSGNDVYFLTIENNTFNTSIYDPVSAGINGAAGQTMVINSLIRNNTFTNFNQYGIQINAENTVIANNTVTNSSGITVSSGNNNTIENNTFIKNSGLDISSTLTNIRYNTIRGITASGAYAVFVGDNNNTIENNTIEYNASNSGCVGIYDGNYYTTIRYNTITSNQKPSDMSGCYGVQSEGNDGNITDNMIKGFETGIYVILENVHVYNNIINRTTYGVYIEYDNHTIENNVIEDAQAYGIYVTGSNYINILRNRFCRNAVALYNDTAVPVLDNNTFCVDIVHPANSTQTSSITNFTVNVTNPIFTNEATGAMNTSCQLYVDSAPVSSAVNNSVFNNNLTEFIYTPTGSPTSWFVACNDSATTNWGNSSIYYFYNPAAAAATPAATTVTTTAPSGVRSEAAQVLVPSDGHKTASAPRGESSTTTIGITNNGNVIMRDIEMSATGVPESWYAFDPESFDYIDVGDTVYSDFTLAPPPSAEAGEYDIEVFAGEHSVADITAMILFAAECSACPEGTGWSSCAAEMQERTTYSCSEETFNECLPETEKRVCVAGVPVMPWNEVYQGIAAVVIGALGIFLYLWKMK